MPRNTNAFKAKLPAFHRALQQWYGAHGRRELPWRTTHDPYRIYISEIMLQQTQVKTVLERYWQPFLKRFPTLKALAAAARQDVTKAWEGLGYYNRAANLHKAAQLCKGAMPKSVDALMELPGIGRNTAHAVACFAYGAPVPVMEANVKRVLCRVFALREADSATLWQKAEALLDRKNPYDYNQAMMDIGALVCTKRNPRCGECPLAVLCEGKSSPASYPAAKAAKAVPVRRRIIVAYHDGQGGYYLTQRKSKFLNGLYGFTEYEAMPKLKAAKRLGAVTQSYSHFTLEADVFSARGAPKGMHKATVAEMKTLPLSRADHKVMRLLEEFC